MSASPVLPAHAIVRRDIARWGGTTLAACLLLALWGPPAATGLDAAFLEKSTLLAVLVAMAIADARTCEIPDALCGGIVVVHYIFTIWLWCAGGLGMKAGVSAGGTGLGALAGSLLSDLLSGLALGGGLLGFTLAYERVSGEFAMGGGDIKLMGALGFAYGLEAAVWLLFAACGAFLAAFGLRQMKARMGAAAGGAREAVVQAEEQDIAAGYPGHAQEPDAPSGNHAEAAAFGPAIAAGAFLVSLFA